MERQEAKKPRSRGKQSVSVWRPGPQRQAELERIWHAVDDDGRKMLLYFARQLAKEQGVMPPGTRLVMTDQVF